MSQSTARGLRAATPMIHVPDVRAAIGWYESIGFSVDLVHDGGSPEADFGIVRCGDTRVMLNGGGHASTADRREVDLYVDVVDVDRRFAELPDGVEIVETVHDTDYGMREFIVRDLNRFWITFGEPRPT